MEPATTGRATRGYRALRNWPLRCCGALCFVTATLEVGSILAVYFNVLALCLVRTAAGRGHTFRISGGAPLLGLTSWPLLLKVIWHSLCAVGWSGLTASWAVVFHLVLSGAPDLSDSCADLQWARSEALLSLAALLHWQFCHDDEDYPPPLSHRFGDMGSAMASESGEAEILDDLPEVARDPDALLARCKAPALLILCGALNTNAFAALYHAAALLLVLDLAALEKWGMEGKLVGKCAGLGVLQLVLGSVTHFLLPIVAATWGLELKQWSLKFFLVPPNDRWRVAQSMAVLAFLAEFWFDTRGSRRRRPRTRSSGAGAPPGGAAPSATGDFSQLETWTTTSEISPSYRQSDAASIEFWRRAVSFEIVNPRTLSAGPASSDDDPAAALPPIVSFIGWLLVWPSLPSLPLLVAGLAALSAPLNAMPHTMLMTAAQYEATICLMAYSYAILCDGMGVPTWWGPQLGVLDLGADRGRELRVLVFTVLPGLTLVLACGARRTLRLPRRGTGVPPWRQSWSSHGWAPGALSWLLFMTRAFAVIVVVVLALVRGPRSMSSLVQLGYLCWLLGLLHLGEEVSSSVVGWDVIRGSPKVWLALLWYSGAASFCALCWRALNIRDIAWLGFARRDSTHEATVIGKMWPHLLLSVLASAQAHALRHPSSQPQHRRLTQVPSALRVPLVTIQFFLLLLVALLDPVSVDSFMFLCLLMVNVLVVTFKMRPALLLPVVRMSSDLAWALLAMRSLLVLHPVQAWLSVVIPQSEFPLTWSTLDLEASEVSATRQVLMALLLLYSRALTGLLEPALLELEERIQVAPLHPSTVECLRFLRGWSPCALILVAHALAVASSDSGDLTFFSWLQLNVVLLLLLSGRKWGHSGCIFSACTCLSLTLQYIHCFDFCRYWPPQPEVRYWGFTWEYRIVAREFVLLGLSVVQRGIHCKVASVDAAEAAQRKAAAAAAALAAQGTPLRSRTLPRTWSAPVASAGAREPLTFEASAAPTFSLPDVSPEMGAAASGSAVAPGAPEHCTFDAQFGAVLVMFVAVLRDRLWSVVAVVLVGVFFISGDSFRKLSVIRARLWLRLFAMALLAHLLWGLLFQVWLPPFLGLLRPDAHHIAQWSICADYEPGFIPRAFNGSRCTPQTLQDRGCMSQRLRCGTEWLKWLGVHEQGHTGRLPEFALFMVLCLFATESRGHRLMQPISAWFHEWGSRWPERWKVTLIYVAFAFKWVALLGSLLAKQTSDAVAVASLGLLLSALSAWGTPALKSNPMRSLLSPTRLISALNFWVIWSTLAFQCPAVPCPYTMDLLSYRGFTPTSFVSREQCVWLEAQAGGWTLSKRSTPMSIFSHCFGLMKSKGPYSAQTFWRLFLFLAVLVQRLLIYCFIDNLERHLDRERQRLRKRGHWYIKQVSALREVQLTAWDTKRQVLLSKLQRLITQHDAFRAIWDGRRKAFSCAEERERFWANRVEDLCLLSGIGKHKVEGLLEEFDNAANTALGRSRQAGLGASLAEFGQAGDEEAAAAACSSTPTSMSEGANDQAHAERLQQIVDRRLLEYLEHHTLRMKRMISADEEIIAKRRLLEACRAECLALAAELEEPAFPPRKSMNMNMTTLRSFFASALGPNQSDAGGTLEMRRAETEPLGDCESVQMEMVAAESDPSSRRRSSSLSSSSEKPPQEDLVEPERSIRFLRPASTATRKDGYEPPAPRLSMSSASTRSQTERAVNSFPDYVRSLLCEWIDDLLFISNRDQTLHHHRRNNGILLLVFKALCSQTLPLLCLASTLQFAMYRSVLAAFSVSIVVLSLMAFPHIPFSLWTCLLNFNTMVVFAKMFFQLPIICEDGTLHTSESACKPCTSVPWVVIAGLFKVGVADPKTDLNCGPKYDSLRSVLWADLFACVAVLLNMLVARCSGRCHSGLELLHLLQSKDSTQQQEETEVLPQYPVASGVFTVYTGESSHDSGSEMLHDDWADEAIGLPLRQRVVRRWQEFRKRVRDITQAVLDGRLRRPAKDLYAIRFFIHMVLLVMIMLAWSTLMNTTRTFSVSLLTNNFDGAQVRLLIVGVLLAVVDRILYTMYRTHPWSRSEEQQLVEGDQQSVRGERRIWFEAPKDDDQGGGVAKGSVGKFRTLAGTLQKVLLIGELVALHCSFINMWTRRTAYSLRNTRLLFEQSNQNAVATMFYILCLTYLGLTSLQMKYDVHVMRGGMRFTHSTDLATKTLFRIYNSMPFLHELRVLTDWTITATSMDFFMWMKFEDAYHMLYMVRCDMEARLQTAFPGQRQPLYMKISVGFGLLILLLVLLIGPVVWFSSLNVLGFQTNIVTEGRLDISLELDKRSYGSRRMNLYSAEPGIVTLDAEQSVDSFGEKDDDDLHFVEAEVPVSRQIARFPVHSDSFWMVPKQSREMIQELLRETEMEEASDEAWTAKLILRFSFEREHTMFAHYEDVVRLHNKDMIEQFARFLNNHPSAKDEHRAEAEDETVARMIFTSDLHRILRLTASSRVTPLPARKKEIALVMALQLHTEGGNQWWSFGLQREDSAPDEPEVAASTRSARSARSAPSGDDASEAAASEAKSSPAAPEAAAGGAGSAPEDIAVEVGAGEPEPVPLELFLMSDDIARASVSAVDEDTGEDTPGMSMKSLYLGVVLTVGSFLRSFFKLSSQRVIYEEMPNTDLLLDLCNGVYIARIQGNLEVEWKLYHELIKIYRSPEVVLRVTAPKAVDDGKVVHHRRASSAAVRYAARAYRAAARAVPPGRTARRSPSPPTQGGGEASAAAAASRYGHCRTPSGGGASVATGSSSASQSAGQGRRRAIPQSRTSKKQKPQQPQHQRSSSH